MMPAVTVTVPDAHDARNNFHAKARWASVDEVRSPTDAAAMESTADSAANALKMIVGHIRLSFSTLKIKMKREPSGPAPLHTRMGTKITRSVDTATQGVVELPATAGMSRELGK